MLDPKSEGEYNNDSIDLTFCCLTWDKIFQNLLLLWQYNAPGWQLTINWSLDLKSVKIDKVAPYLGGNIVHAHSMHGYSSSRLVGA